MTDSAIKPGRRARARHLISVPGCLVAVALVVSAGCSSGDEDPGAPVATGAPSTTELAAQPAGKGVIALDGEQLEFTVSDCREGPGPDDPVEATLIDLVEGTGTSGDDDFIVRVSRYSSDTGVGEPITTENVTVVFGAGDDARGVEARRSTSGPDGAWQDLRDPDAEAPMIVREGASVEVRAVFGPSQSVAGDDGLIDGHLRSTCRS